MILSTKDIQSLVAKRFGIKLEELVGTRQAKRYSRPRHVAMYVIRMTTKKSLPDIAHRFGKKDHTTVLGAIRRIQELMKHNEQFKKDIDSIINDVIILKNRTNLDGDGI